MSELIIWTYDWIPDEPRGFVRDLRLRWACEEAGLAYAVRTVPFDGREANHLSRQPFGQIPFLTTWSSSRAVPVPSTSHGKARR